MSFAEDMAKKFAEGERRRAREDAEAVLAYYEMTEEEREEHDRKCMKALLETMSDGMSTATRVSHDEAQVMSEEQVAYIATALTRPFLHKGKVWTPQHGQPGVYKVQELYRRRTKPQG